MKNVGNKYDINIIASFPTLTKHLGAFFLVLRNSPKLNEFPLKLPNFMNLFSCKSESKNKKTFLSISSKYSVSKAQIISLPLSSVTSFGELSSCSASRYILWDRIQYMMRTLFHVIYMYLLLDFVWGGEFLKFGISRRIYRKGKRDFSLQKILNFFNYIFRISLFLVKSLIFITIMQPKKKFQ